MLYNVYVVISLTNEQTTIKYCFLFAQYPEKLIVPEDVEPRNAGKDAEKSDKETAVYGRRWYVLFVFCLGSFSQVYNTHFVLYLSVGVDKV